MAAAASDADATSASPLLEMVGTNKKCRPGARARSRSPPPRLLPPPLPPRPPPPHVAPTPGPRPPPPRPRAAATCSFSSSKGGGILFFTILNPTHLTPRFHERHPMNMTLASITCQALAQERTRPPRSPPPRRAPVGGAHRVVRRRSGGGAFIIRGRIVGHVEGSGSNPSFVHGDGGSGEGGAGRILLATS
jgi:hypothetical protein